ncbi:UNVERIFIED_CONTAM: hypothetical protein Sangu_1714100, partial [Sesamum angustifolium]
SQTMSDMPTPTGTPTQSRHRHRCRFFDDVYKPCGVGSWPEVKRYKIMGNCMSEEDEIVADCLLMLTRSGGGFYVSSSSIDVDSTSVAGSMERNQLAAAFDTMKDQGPLYSIDPATITAPNFAIDESTTMDESSDTTNTSHTTDTANTSHTTVGLEKFSPMQSLW